MQNLKEILKYTAFYFFGRVCVFTVASRNTIGTGKCVCNCRRIREMGNHLTFEH